MSVKLLTEHHLEFLRLKVGCTGLSESALVKMPHCWKSRVMAHLTFYLETNPSSLRSMLVPGGRSNLLGTTLNTGDGGGGGGGWFCKHRKGCVNNCTSYTLILTANHLGLQARKPVFGVSVKASFKPVSSATETS